MKYSFLAALMLAPAFFAAPALAQVASINQSIAGTRLDLQSHAEVSRVPDIATLSAGRRGSSARRALKDSADCVARVLAVLRALASRSATSRPATSALLRNIAILKTRRCSLRSNT